MATSIPNTGIYILGRTTQQTEVLYGNSLLTSPGQNLRLFMPQFNSKIEQDPQLNTLRKRLCNIKATRVINYLFYTFDADDEQVMINGICLQIKQLRKDFPGIDMLRADEVGPLRFYGGPPSATKWYDGTLLTVLLDKILQAQNAGKRELIDRFLNVDL